MYAFIKPLRNSVYEEYFKKRILVSVAGLRKDWGGSPARGFYKKLHGFLHKRIRCDILILFVRRTNIAQLAERRLRKPMVADSTPVVRS